MALQFTMFQGFFGCSVFFSGFFRFFFLVEKLLETNLITDGPRVCRIFIGAGMIEK